MFRKCLLFLILILFCGNVFASASVVAVVGDELISSIDVEKYLLFMIHELKLPKHEDTSILKRHALKFLVDESLLLQKAAKLGLFLTEIEDKKVWHDVDLYLEKVGDQALGREALHRKFQSRLLWEKIVTKYIIPDVVVSKKEIEDFKEQVRNFDSKSVKIVQVIMPADLSSAIIDIITKRVKNISELVTVANKFSFKVITLDWIPLSQLNHLVRSAVLSLKDGAVSSLFKIESGDYTMIGLEESSDFSSLFLNSDVSFLTITSPNKSVLDDLTSKIKGCDDIMGISESGFMASNVVSGKIKDFNAHLRAIFGRAKVNFLSEPAIEFDGENWQSVLLCDISTDGYYSDDSSIMQNLFSQKLLAQQNFYMDRIRNFMPFTIIGEGF